MAFKAIIHVSASSEYMQGLHKTIDQFRAEKAAKYLGALGVNYDTIRECLQKERIHIPLYAIYELPKQIV